MITTPSSDLSGSLVRSTDAEVFPLPTTKASLAAIAVWKRIGDRAFGAIHRHSTPTLWVPILHNLPEKEAFIMMEGTITPFTLAEFRLHPSLNVRAALARHPYADAATLAALANDPEEAVTYWAINNPHTPWNPDFLVRFGRNPDILGRLLTHPNTPPTAKPTIQRMLLGIKTQARVVLG